MPICLTSARTRTEMKLGLGFDFFFLKSEIVNSTTFISKVGSRNGQAE